MIDLQSEVPLYYWTFDKLEALEEEQDNRQFEGQVWKCDRLPRKPAVSADSVAFEPPDEWEDDPNRTYRFAVTDEGLYVCGGDGFFYEAVRSDIATNTILTGTWNERDYGTGSFILVIPKDAAQQSKT